MLFPSRLCICLIFLRFIYEIPREFHSTSWYALYSTEWLGIGQFLRPFCAEILINFTPDEFSCSDAIKTRTRMRWRETRRRAERKRQSRDTTVVGMPGDSPSHASLDGAWKTKICLWECCDACLHPPHDRSHEFYPKNVWLSSFRHCFPKKFTDTGLRDSKLYFDLWRQESVTKEMLRPIRIHIM